MKTVYCICLTLCFGLAVSAQPVFKGKQERLPDSAAVDSVQLLKRAAHATRYILGNAKITQSSASILFFPSYPGINISHIVTASGSSILTTSGGAAMSVLFRGRKNTSATTDPLHSDAVLASEYYIGNEYTPPRNPAIDPSTLEYWQRDPCWRAVETIGAVISSFNK